VLRPELLILDADDTLWESALFFEKAEKDFLSLVESLDLDPLLVKSEIHKRDLDRLATTGYGAKPYLHTLQTILAELPGGDSDWAVQSFCGIESVLINHPILLMAGVVDTLSEIAAMGILSLVYTMGEFEHQESKFRRSGLDQYVNAFHVVDIKTPETLMGLLTRYSVSPELTVLVGNSPKSDINPALTIGVNAIHILHDQTWAAEREEYIHPDRVVVINHFDEILQVLQEPQLFSAYG
jgi:putative hydrolase of the HAD superfamily